jgi:hypothetical protein
MIIPKTLDMEYIAKLIFDSFLVPVKFIGSDESVLYQFTSVSTINPLYSPNYFSSMIGKNKSYLNIPVLERNEYLENFLKMELRTDDRILGKFIIGPTLTRELPEEMIDGLLNDFSKITGKQELTFYYDSLPKVSKKQLLTISEMLFFLLYHERLDMKEIVNGNQEFMKHTTGQHSPEIEVSRRRENQAFHPPEFYEIAKLRCFNVLKRDEKKI